MSHASRRLAGLLILILPTVAFGGTSLLTLIIGDVPGYMDNPLRQDLWRAGHAHAGIMLILALILLRYVDEAVLSDRAKAAVRMLIPSAAIFMPIGFFLSVLSPEATEPNALIYLVYAGFAVLVVGLLILGVGLMRRPQSKQETGERRAPGAGSEA
jgi:hypothetical protein